MNLTTTIGVIVLLVGMAFAGGCLRGQHNGERDAAIVLAQKDAKLSLLEADIGACASTLTRINDESTRAIAEAQARAARGERAVEEAAIATRDAKDARASAAAAMAAARREPACREQLEMPLCASIPLL